MFFKIILKLGDSYAVLLDCWNDSQFVYDAKYVSSSLVRALLRMDGTYEFGKTSILSSFYLFFVLDHLLHRIRRGSYIRRRPKRGSRLWASQSLRRRHSLRLDRPFFAKYSCYRLRLLRWRYHQAHGPAECICLLMRQSFLNDSSLLTYF